MIAPPRPRLGKRQARTLLEAVSGRPFRELERDMRRREPIDVEGREVEFDIDANEPTSTIKGAATAAERSE